MTKQEVAIQMASEAALRRRIRELQSQIDSLRQQSVSFQNEMNRQMNRRFAELRSEYERALTRQKNETEELYSARIRAFQENMVQEMQQQYQLLEQEAARVSKLQAEKIAELSDCNEELRDVLQRMKSHQEVVDENHRSLATTLLDQMKTARVKVETVPHEFFFKGEFDIIDSHSKQIEDELDQEMYQAAAADASSVMMEFDLLKTKVEQALHEWLMAFQDYARIIKGIAARLEILEANSIETKAGTFVMLPKELNYWSSGTYLPYKQKIQEALALIQEVESQGVVNYLKNELTQERKGIFSKVAEAHKWDDELMGITNCILCERTLSDERWSMSKDVSRMLKDIGYHVIRKGFRSPEDRIKKQEWYPKGSKYSQNPLDCYDLTLTIQGLDKLCVTFIPVRMNGVAVRNECIISINAVSLKDNSLTSEIVGTNVQRVRDKIKNINVSGVAAGASQDAVIASEEQRRKKVPNPKEQIRYLERKYH